MELHSVTEQEADTKQVKEDIAQQMYNRPSALLLSVIRGFSAGLIFSAPRGPRTLHILRELLACVNKWAALGWEPAILFCIYMTQTQLVVAHDLGETSKAISIAKNTLDMIAAHEKVALN